MMPKRLQLVSELVPHASRMALLVNPNNPNAEPISRAAQEAARITGVDLKILQAGSEGEIETAFSSLIQTPADALVVGTDPLLTSRREQVVALAAHHALPATTNIASSPMRAV
jgi:putative ABC transport system substrate-binding protein